MFLPTGLGLVRAIVQFAAVGLLAITLLSLAGRPRFLELLTHFRLQYVLAAVVALVALVICRSPVFAGFALIAAVVNSYYLVPYYFRSPSVAQRPAVRLKLMLANVLYGNSGYRKLLDQIADEQPDVVVLQEFTVRWLAGTESLKITYPYSFVRERPRGAGIAVFSRHPMSETVAIRFDASERAGVFTRLDVEGTSITLLTIHPSTPMTGEKFAQRNSQLVQSAARIRMTKGPRILLGDLNTSIFSPYFKDLVRDSGMRDARLGFGLLNSWPHPLPEFLRIPIDHCLVSSGVEVVGIKTGKGFGSDHLPLVVELAVDCEEKLV
jgi:endonuclease/exonuclease/phosphatase (EEP) superfamily protein YafD